MKQPGTTLSPPPSLAEARSVCELFQGTAAAAGPRPALRKSGGGAPQSWFDYAVRVRRIAEGLSSLGVQRGDTVALMLSNSPEFHLVDVAAMHLGAIPFSIYNTSSPEQVAYLLENSGAQIAVTEQQRLHLIAESGVDLAAIICIDDQVEGCMTLDALERRTVQAFDFDGRWKAVGPGDIATIIYTSGTTGPPKGVELTHGAVLAALRAGQAIDSLAEGSHRGQLLSYLPDAHVANRFFAHYLALVDGGCITTLADLKQIGTVLGEVRPTVFLGVPALWIKFKAVVEQSLDARPGVRSRLARWALRVGHRAAERSHAGRRRGALLAVQHVVADMVVLKHLRRRLGLDRASAVVTGAAPIPKEVLMFFLGLGIELCEGWGMSETAAAGAINIRGQVKPGTVGRAMHGLEMRLADDGELLVRSPTLMRGYRNDPARTAEAIDGQGWLHTGDIARIDVDGFISIVDRKKDIIINTAGKNMSPANIENAVLAACPYVASVMAVGDGRPYVVALISLDEASAGDLARRNGDHADTTLEALAHHPAVIAGVEEGLSRANARLSRVEQIKSFHIVPVTWPPGGDELTPTHKLRRREITAKYAVDIEGLYRSDPAAARQVAAASPLETPAR
jgi:long-subunit acyl-CoA synthetase (AMP-forming)